MTTRSMWLILGLSLVVICGRTLIAAQAGMTRNNGLGQDPGATGVDSTIVAVVRLDSMLAEIGAPERSPFLPPPVKYVPAPAQKKQEGEPPPVIPPRVVLLLQDGQSTMVQLEAGGRTSGKMTVGSQFQGWTIVSIKDNGITVTNGKDNYVLARP